MGESKLNRVIKSFLLVDEVIRIDEYDYMYAITGLLYRNLIKPILFLFPADNVHEFFLNTGRIFGKSNLIKKIIEKSWKYEDTILEQSYFGLNFKNPIGLSAGFDYNADLVNILPSVGFGFNSIGTLTHEAYGGNPPPMLGRLPKSKSLLVNKGFKNLGITNVLQGIKEGPHDGIRGVSIGATNKVYPDFNAMLNDLLAGFLDAEKFNNFDYYELNISCPNVTNSENLDNQIASPSGFKLALSRLEVLHLKRPVFVKMPLERSSEQIKELIEVAKPFPFIKGLIFSNLGKDRTNPLFDPDEIKRAGEGSLSGKPIEAKSNEALRYAYKHYHDRFILIGVGGVFTAEDAYKKIRCGASLVQMITGMVYMGPQQIGLINKELAGLLRKDGYKNIREAVGAMV